MRARRLAWTAALIAGAALAGACSGGIPHADPAAVTRARVRWPEITTAELELGRDRYVARCSGCHALHRPSEQSPRAWKELVEKMAPRAKLSGEDRELIRRYLTVMSVAPAD